MEWVPIAALVFSIGAPIVGWFFQRSKLDGIFQARDKINENRIKQLEEDFRRSDSGVLALKIVHAEIAIDDLDDWRKSCVNPYVPAQIDLLKNRVDSLEREIGTHDTGMRGSSHRNSNKLTELEGRISELELRLKLRNERQDRR